MTIAAGYVLLSAPWGQISMVRVTSLWRWGFSWNGPAVAPGNLIVVARSSSLGTTQTISGVNDNAGNTYVEAGALSLRNGSTVRWE